MCIKIRKFWTATETIGSTALTSDNTHIEPFQLLLTGEQFAAALRKGQGRALLHVKQRGIGSFDDLLLDACTQSLVLDVQSEGTRGEWLFSLLELANLKERARMAVLSSLQAARPTTTDFWTVTQLMVLALFFAREGHEDCRRALYAKFERQEYQESWVGGDQIVSLDGLDGFLHVAEVIGARLLREPDYWDDEYLIDCAAEGFGREAVLAALEERAKGHDHVRAYLQQIQRHERKKSMRQLPERKSLDQVLLMIEETSDGHLWALGHWAVKANDDELNIILSRMQNETRVAQLRGYLRVFRLRPMPELPQCVFDLVTADDEELSEAAIRALSHSCDDRVRELAIGLLKQSPPRLDGLPLFEKNYQPGDHLLWEPLFPRAGDADFLHAIALDFVRMAKEVKGDDLKDSLLWAYEYSPCSFCRQSAFKELVEREAAPRYVVEECLWDCQDETRDLAKSILTAPPS